MTRFNVAGLAFEIRPWRVVVWLLVFGAWCLWFDAMVSSLWIELPAEVVFAAYLEWLFPAFGVWRAVGELRAAWRGLRRLRTEAVGRGSEDA